MVPSETLPPEGKNWKWLSMSYCRKKDVQIKQGKWIGEIIDHNGYYRGDFENGLLNGYGYYIASSNSKGILIGEHNNEDLFTNSCEGFFKNGVLDGKGIAKGNNFIYKGEFQDGFFHGKGKLELTFEVYEGIWKEGKKNGKMKYYSIGICRSGEYLMGKPNDEMKTQYPQGAVIFKNMKSEDDFNNDGYGTIYYANGSHYYGSIQKCWRNGKGTLFVDDFSITGEWKLGSINGSCEIHWDLGHKNGGTSFIGTMKNNIVNGTGTFFLKNGTTVTGKFQDGKRYSEKNEKYCEDLFDNRKFPFILT